MKKALGKIINILIDILIVLVLIFSALIATLSLTSRDTGVPNIFGKVPLSVQTDSMEGEFFAGDLIISTRTDENTVFKVGDIVTYPITINNVKTTQTHRIIEIKEENGYKQYVTMGDNSEAIDSDLQSDSTILAVYDGTRVQGMGSVMDFFRSSDGFFIVIVIPMIIFFIYAILRVIRSAVAYNREKILQQGADALSEEEKKRLVEEFLAKEKEEQAENQEDFSKDFEGNAEK